MDIPFFSVVIPAYNRASVLKETLPQLLNQSFGDFEVIIADDGSSDNTKQIVGNFNDHRIRYFFQQNAGVCTARNSGAKHATGEYIIFLDSDDHTENNWLQDFYDVLREYKKDIAFCAVKVISKSNVRTINPEDPYNSKSDWGVFLAGAFALRKKIFFDVGMYDVNVRFGENTELSYRIKKQNVVPAFIHKPNLVYKPSVGGGSKNLQNRIESNLYILDKHKDWFSKRPSSKRFYLQTAAIASYKLNKISQAKKLLWKAWLLKPFNFTGFIRILILNFPFIAKKMWKPQIDQ